MWLGYQPGCLANRNCNKKNPRLNFPPGPPQQCFRGSASSGGSKKHARPSVLKKFDAPQHAGTGPSSDTPVKKKSTGPQGGTTWAYVPPRLGSILHVYAFFTRVLLNPFKECRWRNAQICLWRAPVLRRPLWGLPVAGGIACVSILVYASARKQV